MESSTSARRWTAVDMRVAIILAVPLWVFVIGILPIPIEIAWMFGVIGLLFTAMQIENWPYANKSVFDFDPERTTHPRRNGRLLLGFMVAAFITGGYLGVPRELSCLTVMAGLFLAISVLGVLMPQARRLCPCLVRR